MRFLIPFVPVAVVADIVHNLGKPNVIGASFVDDRNDVRYLQIDVWDRSIVVWFQTTPSPPGG